MCDLLIGDFKIENWLGIFHVSYVTKYDVCILYIRVKV